MLKNKINGDIFDINGIFSFIL
jgi:hypothetical protein